MAEKKKPGLLGSIIGPNNLFNQYVMRPFVKGTVNILKGTGNLLGKGLGLARKGLGKAVSVFPGGDKLASYTGQTWDNVKQSWKNRFDKFKLAPEMGKIKNLIEKFKMLAIKLILKLKDNLVNQSLKDASQIKNFKQDLADGKNVTKLPDAYKDTFDISKGQDKSIVKGLNNAMDKDKQSLKLTQGQPSLGQFKKGKTPNEKGKMNIAPGADDKTLAIATKGTTLVGAKLPSAPPKAMSR